MPDPTLLFAMGALLLAVGAFAGFLAGLLGVGGGIVLVPGFFYAFATLGFVGPDLMRVCLATSLATIVVTSTRSLAAHRRRGAVDMGLLRAWAPGIAIGALGGVAAASALDTRALQGVFGALALVIATFLGFGRDRWRIAEEMPGRGLRAVLSPSMGFLSTLMGIGGGSFGVPLLTLYGRPIHQAVATAAGFGVLIAVPSVLGFLLTGVEPGSRPPGTIGAVNLYGFAVIVAMTLLTAPLGAAAAHRTDAAPLRRVFALFLAAVAVNMLVSAIRG